MSDNLIESVAPILSPPVTREPILSASEGDGGASTATQGNPGHTFADE